MVESLNVAREQRRLQETYFLVVSFPLHFPVQGPLLLGISILVLVGNESRLRRSLQLTNSYSFKSSLS